jgi:hypothetical protein
MTTVLSGFRPGPSDPPSGTVDVWRSIRISFEIQPGSASLISNTLVQTELATLGITSAQCFRPIKIQAFAQAGTAANQNIPTVELSVDDPTNGGNLGVKKDTGSLSTPAHLHYHYPQHITQGSFNFTQPRNLAQIEITNSPAGTCVFTLSYLI